MLWSEQVDWPNLESETPVDGEQVALWVHVKVGVEVRENCSNCFILFLIDCD